MNRYSRNRDRMPTAASSTAFSGYAAGIPLPNSQGHLQRENGQSHHQGYQPRKPRIQIGTGPSHSLKPDKNTTDGNRKQQSGTTHHKTSASESSAVSYVREKEVELSNLLECPVCFCIPEKEIFNCERGHSCCSDCWNKLARCALCAAPKTKNNSRNFMVESLIAYFRKYSIPLECLPVKNQPTLSSCEYKADGCKAIVTPSHANVHASKCDYRAAKCLVENCESKELKLSLYFRHLKEVHGIIGLSNSSGNFMKTDRLFMGLEINSCWKPFYMEYDGRVFLRHANIRNRNVMWWVQLIGADSEARKYTVNLGLENSDKRMKIAWTLPVHPIRTSHQDIEKSKEIASISTAKLLPFCVLNEQFEDRVATHTWSFNMTITKII